MQVKSGLLLHMIMLYKETLHGSQTGGSVAPPEYIKHSPTWTLLTLSSLAADGTHAHAHTHTLKHMQGPKVRHTHTQIGTQSRLVIGQSAGNCLHFEFV